MTGVGDRSPVVRRGCNRRHNGTRVELKTTRSVGPTNRAICGRYPGRFCDLCPGGTVSCLPPTRTTQESLRSSNSYAQVAGHRPGQRQEDAQLDGPR